MKEYIVKNINECIDTFLDIVENTKQGFVRCEYEDPKYYNGKSVVINVIDTALASVVYVTDNDYGEKFDDYADTVMNKGTLFKFRPICAYVKGKLYEASFGYSAGFIDYAFRNGAKDRMVSLGDIATEIMRRVVEQVREGLFALYPDYASIPDKYKNFDYDYKTEALNLLMNDVDTETFSFELNEYNVPEEDNDPRPYCNYKTCLGYCNAVEEGTDDEFILNKVDRFLNFERVRLETTEINSEILIKKLGFFYRLREEARIAMQNLEEDDRLHLEIKSKIRDFLKDNEANMLRVTINGRDDMLDGYTKRRYPRFTIEGREVVVRVTPEILMSMSHGDGYCVGWRRYDTKIESPVLRETYGTSKVRYLDVVYPHDIKSIRFNRTVIYEKKENAEN